MWNRTIGTNYQQIYDYKSWKYKPIQTIYKNVNKTEVLDTQEHKSDIKGSIFYRSGIKKTDREYSRTKP